ncbi:hypothetical protein [Chitinophaga pinensis]|uniref:Uncharacterized protein n=1 Tax=Chitinophaga pinensis (strain ATCC 43595 / DSM 2588 / LMG 13176 / NBRC 15968 / NCIMB 11800 / UQM 2034) TaxID=485918 RepID=A0A979GQD3_CHIPD|nr:hypothetical protein [Chitinophaga pinensis]ACU61327.1 hypothetical protein Cpin_3865 [Chitinophaga pinensis DSM 2588]
MRYILFSVAAALVFIVGLVATKEVIEPSSLQQIEDDDSYYFVAGHHRFVLCQGGELLVLEEQMN